MKTDFESKGSLGLALSEKRASDKDYDAFKSYVHAREGDALYTGVGLVRK